MFGFLKELSGWPWILTIKTHGSSINDLGESRVQVPLDLFTMTLCTFILVSCRAVIIRQTVFHHGLEC